MYSGICKGGPMDGRKLTHTLPTKVFAVLVQSRNGARVITADDPEPIPTNAAYTITGHYSWSYTADCWEWRGS